jgi:hypothetical protein
MESATWSLSSLFSGGAVFWAGVCFSLAIAAYFLWRNSRALLSIRRAVKGINPSTDLPELRFQGYDEEFLTEFIATAKSATTAAGAQALDFYISPTLIWNDVCFAIAAAAFLALFGLNIAHQIPHWRYSFYLSAFCTAMSLVYGAADVAEDIVLVRLFKAPAPVDKRSVRLASRLTQAKFLTFCLAAIGLLIFVVVNWRMSLALAPVAVVITACIHPVLARMLWAARMSVVSALGGYLLFLFVVPAQDLFSDTTFGEDGFSLTHIAYWAGFYALLFFVWAFPVHYAARRTLASKPVEWFVPRYAVDNYLAAGNDGPTLPPIDQWLVRWVPRILGAVPIVAVLIGIICAAALTWRAGALVPGLKLQYVLLIAGAIATLALFIPAAAYRTTIVSRLAPGSRAIWIERASLIITAALFVFLYVAPLTATHFAARAALVPVLFGSWVLLFSWIAERSDLAGRPYLLFALLAAGALTAANAHFNDVRTLPSHVGSAHRQMAMRDAVNRWRMANGCPAATAPSEDKKVVITCPPALILAADGGGSRAAFFTATVVGQFLDTFQSTYLQDAPQAQSGNPARRIFAMSGVSGGAFGLAVTKAALLDSGAQPPCANPPITWRRCLQRLVDGDFLSPAFVGLGLRDNFAPPVYPFNDPNAWGDRAAVLEQAWERHYLDETGAPSNVCVDGGPQEKGLCRAFGYPGASAAWVPLLLLNGTSVQTGRRIIASELESTWVDHRRPDLGVAPRQDLYQWAYDLFEMMAAPCPTAPIGNAPCDATHMDLLRDAAPDVRLSTAALLSARFPILSPAGAIHMPDGMHGDGVVDGGYFENSGLTTALNVAAALNAFGIKPIVLSISNAPRQEASAATILAKLETPPRPGFGPKIADASQGNFGVRLLGAIYAPIAAMLATNSGHEDEAGSLLFQNLQAWDVPAALSSSEASSDKYLVFFSAQVFANGSVSGENNGDPCPKGGPADRAFSMPDLSMSWWLSTAVRRALDAQMCQSDNTTEFTRLSERLDKRGLPDAANP